ncbi:hypothetical protein [Wolbachia endosymbiont of Nilaparvata lugens]|uniref:hypothetical protein n=1 Tax=Wolbachia endosymbiont of Nilaparvata lugens TaxID=357143 RepID=UPI00131549C7|nr:hypothetical protein [Wolbachia endosymbiont of Nilaparvata lugens]
MFLPTDVCFFVEHYSDCNTDGWSSIGLGLSLKEDRAEEVPRPLSLAELSSLILCASSS